MKIYLDATTLAALGAVDELDLVTSFDDPIWSLDPVADEVDTEPARGNLSEFLDRTDVLVSGCGDDLLDETPEATARAKRALDEGRVTGDVAILTRIVERRRKELDSAVISDDRRLRVTAAEYDARVTGTVGVVVRAVAEGRLTEREATDLLGRLDGHGLHTTDELREKADELIERAARRVGDED